MATSYTPNLGLAKPATSDRNWDVPINNNTNAIDGIAPLGGLFAKTAESPSTSLNVAVSAGSYVDASGAIASYAGGTTNVSASVTTNLWLTNAGILAIGSAWPVSAHVRLCVVVATTASLVSVTDARIAYAVGGFPGLTFPASGPAPRLGSATLAAGAVTVSTTAITANSLVFLSAKTAIGAPGFLSIANVVAATSFRIVSSSATDTSIVSWLIVEPY